MSAKYEVRDVGRKGIYSLVEVRAKGEVSQGLRKVLHVFVEEGPKCEVRNMLVAACQLVDRITNVNPTLRYLRTAGR